MIGRPQGNLSPEDRAKLRRAGIVLLVWLVLAVVLTNVFARADVSAGVAAAAIAALTFVVVAIIVFGIFKIQRFSAQMRRENRARPRKERAKRWAISLALSGLLCLSIWKQYDNARVSIAVMGVGVVTAVIDIARGPR